MKLDRCASAVYLCISDDNIPLFSLLNHHHCILTTVQPCHHHCDVITVSLPSSSSSLSHPLIGAAELITASLLSPLSSIPPKSRRVSPHDHRARRCITARPPCAIAVSPPLYRRRATPCAITPSPHQHPSFREISYYARIHTPVSNVVSLWPLLFKR